MSGKLTTHVLDTANGCPGQEIAIALWKLDERPRFETPRRRQAQGNAQIAADRRTLKGTPSDKGTREFDTKADSRTLLKTVKTNRDGRTDEPLLADEEVTVHSPPL